MDRQDEQRPVQPAGSEPERSEDASARIAELERALESTRASLERIKRASSAEGAPARAPEAEGEAPEREGLQEPGEVEQPEAQAAQEEQEEGRVEEEAEEGEEESAVLFDGTKESMKAWKKVGSGELEHQDDALRMMPGNDRGLAYYTAGRFDDFRLKAQYRLDKPDLATSLVVRFLDPEKPVAEREHPERKHHYDNQAYVAVHTGFEVSLGTGLGGDAGTLVGIPFGDAPGSQAHPATAEVKAGEWNEIEIEARGDDYTVRLNGVETARFTNTDSWRGRLAASGTEAGHVGILMGAQPQAGRPAWGRSARCPRRSRDRFFRAASPRDRTPRAFRSAASSCRSSRAKQRLRRPGKSASEGTWRRSIKR